jgi:hypothetical protein
MKLLPLVLVLAACNSKGKPPETGAAGSAAPVVSAGSAGSAGSAATAPVPPQNDLCRIGIDAIDHASCGSASLQSARKSLETITATVQTTGTNDPHAYEVTCARLVDAIDRDAAKSGCTLQLDAGLRATIKKDVDEYYGQRTPVTPTGDAAADAIVTKVAAVRDAACACKDQACIDGVDKKLVAIPAMPGTAPQAARDLATKLLDDASRCAQRVKLMQ